MKKAKTTSQIRGSCFKLPFHNISNVFFLFLMRIERFHGIILTEKHIWEVSCIPTLNVPNFHFMTKKNKNNLKAVLSSHWSCFFFLLVCGAAPFKSIRFKGKMKISLFLQPRLVHLVVFTTRACAAAYVSWSGQVWRWVAVWTVGRPLHCYTLEVACANPGSAGERLQIDMGLRLAAQSWPDMWRTDTTFGGDRPRFGCDWRAAPCGCSADMTISVAFSMSSPYCEQVLALRC